jgi:hypothetical protein
VAAYVAGTSDGLSELTDLLIAQLEREGKRKQLIAAIRDFVPTE